MTTPMKKQDQQDQGDVDPRPTDSQDIDRVVDAEQQGMTELPDREAMSLVNANLAAPINAAVALNALSDGSTAVADAQQTAPIHQGIG